MGRRKTLGELQLAIMNILWTEGEATSAQVHQALLEERGLAPTTIATMLRKMETKGVVKHRLEGRQFIYSPTVERSDVHRSMVAELVERLFAGDPKALVSHLVDAGEVEWEELEVLRRSLERAQEDKDQESRES